VWTWGNNVVGQLGDGTLGGPTCPGGQSVCQTVPVQVVGLTNVIAIRASALYTIALKDDGSLWTWGVTPGNQGTLGIGETGGTMYPVPVPVIDIAQVGWSGSPTSPPLAFGDAAMSAFATHDGHTLAMGAVTGGNLPAGVILFIRESGPNCQLPIPETCVMSADIAHIRQRMQP